jgi:DNA-binding MarR family transcriptional regulator
MLRFIIGAARLRTAIGSDIPIQQVMILVHLWLHGKCRQTELCKELGMLRAAVSRHCRSLSSYNVRGDNGAIEKGQHLLVTERDTYLRHDYYCLSGRGQEVMDRFAADLAGLSS